MVSGESLWQSVVIAVTKGTGKPNWTEIFMRRPELESPGYKETVEEIKRLMKEKKANQCSKKGGKK